MNFGGTQFIAQQPIRKYTRGGGKTDHNINRHDKTLRNNTYYVMLNLKSDPGINIFKNCIN